MSGALLGRSAAATPAVREPQPPGTAAAGDHARPPPAGARSPGQALRRCFSNSDSSSRNSNQQVCGGVQGRLEVAASRSAASALILPPPPPLPGPPGSNLTPAGGLGPLPRSARNVRTPSTTQDGGGACPSPSPDSRLAALSTNRCWNSEERGGSKRSLRPRAATALSYGEAQLSRGFSGPLWAPH